MDTERIPSRAIAIVIVAFLFVVNVHLWWQSRETKKRRQNGEMVMDNARVSSEDGELDFGAERAGTGERLSARKRELQHLLRVLARSSEPAQRRSAALRLQYLADQSAEPELLRMLESEDRVVARRCAEALLGLWQESDSPSVNRLMKSGISAYESGEYKEAMARFEMCARLDDEIPDLHRLRGEILLSQGRIQEAIQAAEKALALKPENFAAQYVLARCYLRRSLGDEALQEVEELLDIYPGYQPARQLREEILSLQKAGGL